MNKIYYFTGSGNSLAIAKKIAENIGNCELIRVSLMLDFYEPVQAEKLGFVFPVYAWGMPVLFKEFIEEMTIKKADYIFSITNYAGNGGNVLGLFDKIIRSKGFVVDAYGEVIMPSNYVVMGNAASKGEAEKILAKAKPVIEKLAKSISENEKLGMKIPKTYSKLLTSIVYPFFASNIRNSDKSFYTTENCTSCGICLNVCPAENIRFNENNKPYWKHQCEQCHACLHWCPVHAIEFSKKTSLKNRYHHPDITLEEVSDQ